MILFRNFVNIFYVSELKRKLLFTLGILIIDRLGCHIPAIGIDVDKLSDIVRSGTGLGGLFSYLDLFSGGSLSQGMLFGLGISPYITASIMMQLLTLSVPTFEQLQKEGEYGRKIIRQYTRYLALAVALVQSFGLSFLMERNDLVIAPGFTFRIMFTLSLTIGSLFVMWLGDQISQYGLGDGSSMIIFAGIVARFPSDVIRTIGTVQRGDLDPLIALMLLLVFIAVAACVVFLEKGERKIPVQYARRVVGQKVYGGQSSYIPFKINTPGVAPVIFASAFLNIPLFAASFLANHFGIFKNFFDSFSAGGVVYNLVNFILIIVFSFCYTALIFDPEQLADNLKKGNAFIPGIRPGKNTVDFFNYILTRIGLVGAIYLGLLVLLPTFIQRIFSLPFWLSSFGGTSILIMVGVALDISARIETYLIEHRYEGFLMSGRLRGRR